MGRSVWRASSGIRRSSAALASSSHPETSRGWRRFVTQTAAQTYAAHRNTDHHLCSFRSILCVCLANVKGTMSPNGYVSIINYEWWENTEGKSCLKCNSDAVLYWWPFGYFGWSSSSSPGSVFYASGAVWASEVPPRAQLKEWRGSAAQRLPQAGRAQGRWAAGRWQIFCVGNGMCQSACKVKGKWAGRRGSERRDQEEVRMSYCTGLSEQKVLFFSNSFKAPVPRDQFLREY